MRAAKVQASLRIRAVSPEPSLLAHTSSESRGTFRQKARSLALWIAGHAQLKYVMTECSKTQIRLTGLIMSQYVGMLQYLLTQCMELEEAADQEQCDFWPYWKGCMRAIWATSWENLFMPYGNNKGADQPAHPHSLISTFVVCCLDSILPLLAIAEISRP